MNHDLYPEGLDSTTDTRIQGSLRKPTLAQVGLLYSLVVILFLAFGSMAQRREFYSGILITEFAIIMLPALVMLAIYKYDMRRVLRLNRISILTLFLIFCIMVFALPVVGVFNYINLMVIKQIFGRVLVQQVPVAKTWVELIANVLVIGGSAGICEEILFRGTIQRGFERLGVVKALLITSFLFGLMHVDFQKLLGTFLLGGLIGFIVYRTNSLFGGIFAHFTNNSLAVLLAYGANKYMELLKASGLDKGQFNTGGDIPSFADMTTIQIIATVVVLGSIFVFCVLALTGLMIAFLRTTGEKIEKNDNNNLRLPAKGLAWVMPGVVVIGFIYFAQGARMLGIKIAAVEAVLQLLGLK